MSCQRRLCKRNLRYMQILGSLNCGLEKILPWSTSIVALVNIYFCAGQHLFLQTTVWSKYFLRMQIFIVLLSLILAILPPTPSSVFFLLNCWWEQVCSFTVDAIPLRDMQTCSHQQFKRKKTELGVGGRIARMRLSSTMKICIRRKYFDHTVVCKNRCWPAQK
jgi:hypothetical protein